MLIETILVLTASRSKRSRAWGASVSLLAFLLTQWLMPNVFLLQSVAAQQSGYEKRSVRTWQEQQVGSDAMRRFDYAYDRVNQLKGEMLHTAGQTAPVYDTQWNYDAMGNRTQSSSTASVPVTPQAPNGLRTTSASYTPNALNQWVSGSYAFSDGSAPAASTCSYDVSGNLVQQTNTQGSGAQTTTTGSTQYAYDSLDRLGSITTYNPGTGMQQHQSVFLYDGLNRKRIAREADWQNGAWSQSSEVRYLYDGLDVIQERDANNQVLASYTRAGNIGGLLARTTFGVAGPYGTTPGSVYFHYDGAGNVSQLTDSSGATVAKYAYDAWGNGIEASGPAAASNRYRYSTKELHAASGLYDFGFRFYSTSLGKWMNRDPKAEGGGMNLYAYAANNPVSYSDAYGLSVTTAMHGFAAGFGVSVIMAYVVAASVGIVASAFSGAGPIIAVVGGLLGAMALADMMAQVRAIEESNLCPDEKDYQLGQLAGSFLGSIVGGGLGNKFGPKPGPQEPPGSPPNGPKPPEPQCFVAGTVVLMADGSSKSIEQIKKGDLVLSRDEKSGEVSTKKVEEISKRQAPDSTTLVLSFSDGEKIETTSEHPFYVAVNCPHRPIQRKIRI